MDVQVEDLRNYYSALSDEALLELKPEDLTEIACQCYEVELHQRGLTRSAIADSMESEGQIAQLPRAPLAKSVESEYEIDDLPWKSSAVMLAEYTELEEAENALDALNDGAIPCALAAKHQQGSGNYPRGVPWLALFVPRESLEAGEKRLQTVIIEPMLEENYANHFAEFLDDELLRLDPDTLPENGRKYWVAELEKRALEPEREGWISSPVPEPSATDGYVAAATLIGDEADAARRLLDRASIPCRIERDNTERFFNSFVILVPASSAEQASQILSEHETEIFEAGKKGPRSNER